MKKSLLVPMKNVIALHILKPYLKAISDKVVLEDMQHDPYYIEPSIKEMEHFGCNVPPL